MSSISRARARGHGHEVGLGDEGALDPHAVYRIRYAAMAKDTLPGAGMNKFDKLGAFYLGRLRDEAKAPLLYDSKDLTTHGLIVEGNFGPGF